MRPVDVGLQARPSALPRSPVGTRRLVAEQLYIDPEESINCDARVEACAPEDSKSWQMTNVRGGASMARATRPEIRVKRIYDPAEPDDGYRVLIDHVWPRGLTKQRAALDEWAKELAPSDGLRKWFDHKPERFEEFRSRYRAELEQHGGKLEELRAMARKGRVTVLYAARDQDHNNAVVLAQLLRDG